MSMDENVLVYVHKDMLQYNGYMQQRNGKKSLRTLFFYLFFYCGIIIKKDKL